MRSDERDDHLAAALRDRHADTLRGALADLDVMPAVDVELYVSAFDARTRAGQHLAFHLANLLGRLEGVVATVRITVDVDAMSDERGGVTPSDEMTTADSEGRLVQLLSGVDPRHPTGAPDLSAVLAAAVTLAAPHRMQPRATGAVVENDESEGRARRIRVCVGRPAKRTETTPAEFPRDADIDDVSDTVYVAADDWTAYVGREEGPGCDPLAVFPFGAQAAAAFATAEVFRLARAQGALRDGPRQMAYSVWSCSVRSDGRSDGPKGAMLLEGLRSGIPEFTLAGVGAVGSAFLLTLWASGIGVANVVAVDGDAVSTTNLNRYVLFGLDDVRQPKASRAAALLRRVPDAGVHPVAPFEVQGIDEWWATYRRAEPAPIRLLVSAVDKNVPRHQLQEALPRVILGGSTHELRAEVDRYTLADPSSRCLKCHNPPEIIETDAAMRERLLAMTRDQLAHEAEDRGVDFDQLRRYVDDLRAGGNGCAILAGPSLEKLRRNPAEGAFAVSFVSSLAGTLLAAQLVREAAGQPLLTGGKDRANVQFWRPSAPVNAVRATAPQPGCWCADPAVRAGYSELWDRGPESSSNP